MDETMDKIKTVFKLEYLRDRALASGEIYVFDKVVDQLGRLYRYRIHNSEEMKKKFSRKEYEQQLVSLPHSVQANCF